MRGNPRSPHPDTCAEDDGRNPTIALAQSMIEPMSDWLKHADKSSRAELERHEMRRESGRAVPWTPASEPLNDQQQNQLKSNRPADINANINGRARPAG